MIKYLRLLLFPFSLLYGGIVILRNKLYDLGILPSVSFSLPVICVGNLVVGGSGKSPVTEYLVSLFPGQRVAILSRGYGRQTKGFLLADQFATAETIGDEPMQFYSKFPQVTVAVCESRVEGIRRLEAAHDIIILDDAFQHRALKPGFSILLFEYQKLLKAQYLLPAGNLREPFWAYKRADLLLITKAPEEYNAGQKQSCQRRFDEGAGHRLFFSGLEYGQLSPVFSGSQRSAAPITAQTKIFLLTGIANPSPLTAKLSSYGKKIQHFEYPDHHKFSRSEIEGLVSAFGKDPSAEKMIITTEKDAQRLKSDDLRELLLNLPVFYLPVKIALASEDKATFDQKILDYVSGTTRNR